MLLNSLIYAVAASRIDLNYHVTDIRSGQLKSRKKVFIRVGLIWDRIKNGLTQPKNMQT